jgi:hypothetical protein
VVIKSVVGFSDQLTVEPLFTAARLIATDQEYGPPMWVESKSYTPHSVCGFKPQFFHVRVMGAVEGVDPGAAQRGANSMSLKTYVVKYIY